MEIDFEDMTLGQVREIAAKAQEMGLGPVPQASDAASPLIGTRCVVRCRDDGSGDGTGDGGGTGRWDGSGNSNGDGEGGGYGHGAGYGNGEGDATGIDDWDGARIRVSNVPLMPREHPDTLDDEDATMPTPRPTGVSITLTPALLRRIEAAGFKPGSENIAGWLVQMAEAAAKSS